MKILIWHRGPVRPPADNCIKNMNLLKSDFNEDFEIEELISTYNHFNADELYLKYKVDYFLSMKSLSGDLIKSVVSKTLLPSGTKTSNMFKQYYTNKIVSNFIYNLEKYDFIVMSRMDIKLSIKNSVKKWFNQGKYTTIHTRTDCFINDQFAIAEPYIMKSAWDYKNLQNLTKFINESNCGEDILDKIIFENNIETYSMRSESMCEPDEWLHDPLRVNVVI